MKKLKVLAVLLTLVMFTNVYAALQSRQGVKTKVSTTASDFFKLTREMEAEGGALGLNATFAEDPVTGEYKETSPSNNIDMHMCKNTEHGTAVMLASSKYGAGTEKLTTPYSFYKDTYTYQAVSSTTGNMTGIFGLGSKGAAAEYVAAGIISKMDVLYNQYLIKAHLKYVDSYADGADANDFLRYIPGDATYETMQFQGISRKFVTSNNPVFERWNGIYGTDGSKGNKDDYNTSRGVVWVGKGL